MNTLPLTPHQQLAISLLAASPLHKKFYWTGGTLLAHYYLHHRTSEDIDFFSSTPFSFNDINAFIQNLKQRGKFSHIEYHKIFDRHEFLLKNAHALRVEFVYYNHEKKTLEERTPYAGILIDSLSDIAANKTMAYFDRTEPKDLVDIYFLMVKKDFTAENLLNLVRRKFGVEFTENVFWSESFKTLPLLKNIKPLLLGTENEQEIVLRQISEYFQENVRNMLSKQLL